MWLVTRPSPATLASIFFGQAAAWRRRHELARLWLHLAHMCRDEAEACMRASVAAYNPAMDAAGGYARESRRESSDASARAMALAIERANSPELYEIEKAILAKLEKERTA